MTINTNHIVPQEALPIFGRDAVSDHDRTPLAPEEVDWACCKSTVYLITPEVASRWLKRNTHNRHPRERHVAAIARDIVEGKWQFNGSALTFDTAGLLLDGQHRLAAIASAGVAVPSVVVTGVMTEAQETIDTGAKRSFGDVLQLRGVPNARNTAAIVMKVWEWRSGAIRWSKGKPTPAELLEVWASIPDIGVDLQRAQAARAAIRASASVYGLASYLFRSLDETDAEAFFERFTSGHGTGDGDPVLALRKRLITNAGARLKFGEAEVLALIIKAWNHFRSGTRIQVLSWQSGGANPEAFPEPR